MKHRSWAKFMALLIVGSACDWAASTPPPPSGEDVVSSMSASLTALPEPKGRYVAATIEIACLSLQETDPQRVASATREIYQRHGFYDPMSYLSLISALESDSVVQNTVLEGQAKCRLH